jgi:transportin-3
MEKSDGSNQQEALIKLLDHIQLLTIFVQTVQPFVGGGENPAVRYWGEVFKALSDVLTGFMDFVPVLERICRCWRHMVISYRTTMTPLLPQMADMLASGFQASREGCFLWATGAILREFSEDREQVDANITESIYKFFESQATTFLQLMSSIQPKEQADLIEDFFRLLVDALCYYPARLILSGEMLTHIFDAAIYALVLEQRDPLVITLHFLLDLLSYAGDNPATSVHTLAPDVAATLRSTVRALIMNRGEQLVKRILAGMMLTFPKDCFADGSSVLLELFRLFPQQTTQWVDHTIGLLPPGTVSPAEAQRLMTKIKSRLDGGDPSNIRQVRALLQDFTNNYRRRNVAPRDGLGQLSGERFRFPG